MSSYVSYRDREHDDTRSYYSRDDGRGSTTVKRYKYGDDKIEDDNARVEVDVRTSHRNRSPERSRVRSRSRSEVFRYERDDYDRDYWRREPEVDEWREVKVTRDVSREPSRRHHDDYELDKYVRSTEYYREPDRHHSPQRIYIRNEAAQPIVIRESREPQQIIIRETVRERSRSPHKKEEREEESSEEVKEDKLELVEKKSEVGDRQVARREKEDDEEYYYQRTTRELARRNREDDRDYRRDTRDSVSNFSKGRERERDRYSDDEVYYKRTVEEEGGSGWGRDHSPHHKRHLAEGAIVGLGAAALLNNRNKKEGRSRSKGANLGRMVGGAVLGTAGAELITRARSRHRGSRSRSRSGSRELIRGRDHHRHDDDRSRSRSGSRDGNWAKLAGVAALGALAGYAATRKKGEPDDRRSRSRRRRSSVFGRSRSRSRAGSEEALNPKHRNNVIAGAGLASAAVAGLVEHARSKSRGGRHRSKSRIRQGIPIAATGLAGAAIAGLYENRKAKKERERGGEMRRGRSTSPQYPPRSRSRSMGPYSSRDMRGSNSNLIEYGGGAIEPEGRRSRSRARSMGSDGSPRRDRSLGPEAAGAGVAGVAAHEASKRRDRRRAERERRYHEDDADDDRSDLPAGGSTYDFGPYAQGPVQNMHNQQQQQQQQQYPSQQAKPQNQPYYNPQHPYDPPQQQQFPPSPQPYQPQQPSGYQTYQPPQQYPLPHDSQQHGGQPGYQPGDERFPRGGGGPNYVSSSQAQRYVPEHYRSVNSIPEEANEDGGHGPARGYGPDRPLNGAHSRGISLNDHPQRRHLSRMDEPPSPRRTRTAPSTPQMQSFPDSGEDYQRPPSSPREPPRRKHRHRRHYSADEPPKYRTRPRAQRSSSVASDATIDLPDRFDSSGRKKPERGDDPLADKLEDFLGKGIGGLFSRFTGGSGNSSRR